MKLAKKMENKNGADYFRVVGKATMEKNLFLGPKVGAKCSNLENKSLNVALLLMEPFCRDLQNYFDV